MSISGLMNWSTCAIGNADRSLNMKVKVQEYDTLRYTFPPILDDAGYPINLSGYDIVFTIKRSKENSITLREILKGNGVSVSGTDNNIISVLTNVNFGHGTFTYSLRSISSAGVITTHYDGRLSAEQGIGSLPSSIAPTISTTLVTFYATAQDTSDLPTVEEIEALPSINSATGSPVTINYAIYNASPKFLVFVEPVTEPPKTKYFFSAGDTGNIGPDGPWASGVVIGEYRLYITNYKTQTGNLPLQFTTS